MSILTRERVDRLALHSARRYRHAMIKGVLAGVALVAFALLPQGCAVETAGDETDLGSVTAAADAADCKDFAAYLIPCGETFSITGEFEMRALNKGVCDPNVGTVELKTSATPSNPKGKCPGAAQECVGDYVAIGLRNVAGKSFTVATSAKVSCK